MINLIIIALLPVLGALTDSFYDEKKKLLSSVFKSLFIAIVAYFLLLDVTIWYVVYLLLCWWVLFDVTYNIVRKLGLFYVGTTKWTDKFLRFLVRNNAFHLSFVTKLCAVGGIFALFYTGRL